MRVLNEFCNGGGEQEGAAFGAVTGHKHENNDGTSYFRRCAVPT